MEQSHNIPMDDEIDKKNDATFNQQLMRLHRLTVIARWLFACFLWLTIAPICLWDLRNEIALWQQYFTWAALRYGLVYHPLSTLGLGFCIGTVLAILIWQSRNMILGISEPEKQRLEKQVWRIRHQGKSHPLWKWICE
ncbi:MAG: hypothetical protein AAF378_17355 [Cyanobacteria bacterium P01_A01_bin.84]